MTTAPASEAYDSESASQVITATRTWLEKAVIGLRLCPFAAAVHLSDRVRYSVSEQTSPAGLLEDLTQELHALLAADPLICETTLLIHPAVLTDFGQYNDFLEETDALLTSLGLDGELQIASFHPDYQFAGTDAQDIENYTNRSPYPMLHLLRESSITQALESFSDIDEVGAENIQTMRRLGHEGWRRLWAEKNS